MSKAERNKRYRKRQRDGKRIAAVEVDADLVNIAVQAKLMTPEQANGADQTALNGAMSTILQFVRDASRFRARTGVMFFSSTLELMPDEHRRRAETEV